MKEPSWQESLELLESLPSLPTEQRVAAIEVLVRNPQPMLRESALRTGAVVISDERLEALLREDADDVLRNAGLEMLKLRGGRGLSLAIRLLQDEDADVVLQSVLVLGHIRDLNALEPLRGALFHQDVNVVQAAIEAVGRLGDHRALADLLPFLEEDAWLQMATIQALGDLRNPAAIEALTGQLTDLLCGEMAADAIARTGGEEALSVLAGHWLRFRAELDAARAVGWIAHVLEGLSGPLSSSPDGLREALAEVLEGDESDAVNAAARALLALGQGREDARALEVLLEAVGDPTVLPVCLANRIDLLNSLWEHGEEGRGWAFRLCARYPDSVDVSALATAVEEADWSEGMSRVALPALETVVDRRVFEALVASYLRASEVEREMLGPLLRTQESVTTPARLTDIEGLTPVESWILLARLRRPVDELTNALDQLDDDRARAEALGQVGDYEALIRTLPWAEWIDRAPEEFLLPAAHAAALYGLRSLLSRLREHLARDPQPHLIRVVGELRDPESPAILIRHLDDGPGTLHPLLLESLGQIGGPVARLQIRRSIQENKVEPRIGYRALSLCAVEEDDAVFRAAVGHPDWYVRLACVEVLGRFGRPENLAALSQLAADSVGVVAQRAIASLERT